VKKNKQIEYLDVDLWYNLKQTAVVQSSPAISKSRIKCMTIHERLKRYGLLFSEKNKGDRIKVHEVMSGTD